MFNNCPLSRVMNIKENITIVVASDNNYAMLLGALIKSVEVNHKTGERLDIHVIDDGISASGRRRITQLSDPSVSLIHWHSGKSIVPTGISIPVDNSSFPPTAYLRLFAPYILPSSVSRFIFLDVDMIVRKDISGLWYTDLQGKTIGAVTDLSGVVSKPYGGISNYRELGLNPDSAYFNSGMLLIDPVKWKAEDISGKVIKCLHDNLEHVSFADQYGLNVVFNEAWTEIDSRWNCVSEMELEDPFIIHFFKVKPIFKSYTGNQAYKEEFYKYLRMTPWKNHRGYPDFVRLYWKAISRFKKIFYRYLS